MTSIVTKLAEGRKWLVNAISHHSVVL